MFERKGATVCDEMKDFGNVINGHIIFQGELRLVLAPRNIIDADR